MSQLKTIHHVPSYFLRLILGGPDKDQAGRRIESSLVQDLQSFKPSSAHNPPSSFLWINGPLCLAVERHQEVDSLVSELELPLSKHVQSVIKEHLDDTGPLLDVCNGLTARVSGIQGSLLLVKHAVCVLDAGANCHSREDLERARSSVKEWLDSVWNEDRTKLGSYGPLLKGLGENLIPRKQPSPSKGFNFWYPCYIARVITVLAFTVTAIATSRIDHLPEIELQLCHDFPWSQPASDLVQIAKEQAVNAGSDVPLINLSKVEQSARAILLQLDRALEHDREIASSKQEEEELILAVQTLKHDSDTLGKEIDSISGKLGELFHLLVACRSSLLDQLMKNSNAW